MFIPHKLIFTVVLMCADVIKVWDCISKWVENNMNQDKVRTLLLK